jgi:cyanate permease
VAGRILWGGFAGRFRRASTALLVMSVTAVLAAGSLLSAHWLGAPAVWGATVALGGSAMAWHAVAWLFIIEEVGAAAVGRASGVVQIGNSLGAAAGPPLLGFVIDGTGSYLVGWIVVAGLFAAMAVLTVLLRRGDDEDGRPNAPAAA